MNFRLLHKNSLLLFIALMAGCCPVPGTYILLDKPDFFAERKSAALEGTCDIVRRSKTVRTRVRLQADSVGTVRGIILDELGVPLGEFRTKGHKLEVTKWFPPLGPSYVRRVGLGLTALMAGNILAELGRDTTITTRLPGTCHVHIETRGASVDSLYLASSSRNLQARFKKRNVLFLSQRGHTLFTFRPGR